MKTTEMIADNPVGVQTTMYVYLNTAIKGLVTRNLTTRTARVLERFGNEAISTIKILTIHTNGTVRTYELGAAREYTGYDANEQLRILCLDFMAGDARWVES
jgi:hypothetical protein